MNCKPYRGLRTLFRTLKCYEHITLILATTVRVGVAGADIPICTTQGDQFSPSVAWSGLNYLVVWEDERNGGRDIYGQLVSHDGVLIDTNFSICVAPRSQRFPQVSWGDSCYLVVWSDSRNNAGHVYGQRISYRGMLLDTNFIISPKWINDFNFCGIDWDSTKYLAVMQYWENIAEANLHGRFVYSDGSMDNTFPISTVEGVEATRSVVWGAVNYLVVWGDRDYPNKIYGQLISAEGILIDSPFVIASAIAMRWDPRVAASADNYLVVWKDDRNGPWWVYGQFVSFDGGPMGNNFLISDAGVDQWNPTVGGGGENYLVVWIDSRDYPYNVWGQRISPSGEFVGSDFYIPSWPMDTASQDEVALSWGKDCYFVVWRDERSVTDSDIYGTFVSSTGVGEAFWQSHNDLFLECYPNPFEDGTVIAYMLPTLSQTSLRIYDSMGRMVKTLSDKRMESGTHVVHWNANDENGNEVAPGIYFYRLVTGYSCRTGKMVVIR